MCQWQALFAVVAQQLGHHMWCPQAQVILNGVKRVEGPRGITVTDFAVLRAFAIKGRGIAMAQAAPADQNAAYTAKSVALNTRGPSAPLHSVQDDSVFDAGLRFRRARETVHPSR